MNERRSSSLVADAIWDPSSVLPLQLLCRRKLRRALARTWLNESPLTDFESFAMSKINSIPLPGYLAEYVVRALPQPNYTPSSSFNQQSSAHALGFGHQYQRRHGLCIHYHDAKICMIGDCGNTPAKPYWAI